VLGSATWLFTSTGWLGYFDSWLALGLLVLAFAGPRWPGWLACLLVPWVDERFVLAAPLALACRRVWRPESFDWKGDLGVPGALLAGFLAVRLGVLSGRSSAEATWGGYWASRDYLAAPPARIALGGWEGLRAGWIFVGASWLLLRDRSRARLGLTAFLLVTLLLGLATAQDYGRSMTMLLPAVLLGLLLAGRAMISWLRMALRAAAALALVLPAHHVMNDAVVPIHNLQHALHFVDHPPPIGADLALAIKLARDPSSPARQRGVLAATQGRWSEALTYFSLMAQSAPRNPDAWFMCAQARFALGDPAGSAADFARAASLAPAEWVTRPDVARFRAKLHPPGGK